MMNYSEIFPIKKIFHSISHPQLDVPTVFQGIMELHSR